MHMPREEFTVGPALFEQAPALRGLVAPNHDRRSANAVLDLDPFHAAMPSVVCEQHQIGLRRCTDQARLFVRRSEVDYAQPVSFGNRTTILFKGTLTLLMTRKDFGRDPVSILAD